MTKEQYEDYLHSPEWKLTAAEAKGRAGNRCQLCNSRKHIEAHHRTYERVGEELAGDLIVLCDACHEKHHGVLPNPTRQALIDRLADLSKQASKAFDMDPVDAAQFVFGQVRKEMGIHS